MIRKLLDNKKFQLVYKILKIIIVVMMVLYLSFVLLQRVTGNKSILGIRVFTVATGSMKPEYEINDVIMVKDVDTNQLKVGDDVAYLGEKSDLKGKIITHRIIDIKTENNQKTFYTQGINSSVPDPSITATQIYGQAVGKIPIITTVNHIVKNQYGFFFLVFLPLVVVVFLEIADTVTEIKYEKKKVESQKEDGSDEEII